MKTDTDRFLEWFAAHNYSVTLAEIGNSQWFAEYRKHICLLKKPPYNLPIERELFRKEPGRNHYFMKPILASNSDGEVTKPQVSPSADGKDQAAVVDIKSDLAKEDPPRPRVSKERTCGGRGTPGPCQCLQKAPSPTPSATFKQIELFGRVAA